MPRNALQKNLKASGRQAASAGEPPTLVDGDEFRIVLAIDLISIGRKARFAIFEGLLQPFERQGMLA